MSLRRSSGGGVRLSIAFAVTMVVVALGAFAVSAGADNSGQLGIWGQEGTAAGKLELPHLMVAGTDGSVFITDRPEEFENLRLQKFSSAGVLEGSVTIPTPDEEVFPAMAIDPSAGRLYLLRDHEGSDPETGKAMAETILVFSTTPSSGTLVQPAGHETLPVPTGNLAGNEAIDNPTAMALDPHNGDLEIAGESRTGKFVLQRIGTSGVGTIGARYTETTNSAELNKATAANAFAVAATATVEPDGTTLILRDNGTASEADFAYTLPIALSGQPVPVPGFTTNAGTVRAQMEFSQEGFGDGFGPQIAVSSDGTTLYFKQAITPGTTTSPGDIFARAFSLADGGNYAVYGGGQEGECAIQNSEAALAPVGETLDILDQGAEAAPSSFGVHLMRFGPGGTDCPEPSAAAALKVGGASVTSVTAGTTVTLDATGSELGTTATEIQSVTWKIEGPGGPVEQTVPKSDPNPLTLQHTFTQEGSYTVRMSMKAPTGNPWSGVFDAKPLHLNVTTAVANEPTVTGVAPSEGPAAGGNTVTITGTHLDGATAVKFGSASATELHEVSATQLTAKAPPGTAGATVDVTVTTPTGTSTTSAADHYKYEGAAPSSPTVSAISPTHGPAAGGTVVTVTGTNLTGATAVKFGSVAATEVNVVGATQLTARAPAGSPAAIVDVSVTTPAGTSALGPSDRYTYDIATQLLTVTKEGNGSGTVTSAPAGIDCGATCAASFNQGASVSLVAASASGSTFAGWGGACSGTGSCVVSMSLAKAVTAKFTANGSSSQQPPSNNPTTPSTPTIPNKPGPKPLKCKAGFKKKKVKGTLKCVKVKKKHHGHGKKH